MHVFSISVHVILRVVQGLILGWPELFQVDDHFDRDKFSYRNDAVGL